MFRIARKLSILALGALGAFSLSPSAYAKLLFTEMMINPPGTDNGFEYMEITGGPSESLNNVWLVVIGNEGPNIGVVTYAVDLTPAGAVGTNGMLLIRDTAGVLTPAPNPATTILINNFTPDLDNDHHGYLLVTGFTSSVTTDLDANDDGVLELLPWTSIIDAISIVKDTPEPDIVSGLGGILLDGLTLFTADVVIRNPNNPAQVIGGDVLGTNPGPYAFDSTRVSNSDPAVLAFATSPGRLNDLGVFGRALKLNEFLLNAPGADNGQEFIEVRGNAEESTDGVTILAVDNNGAAIGTILNAVSIAPSVRIGTNGLLLVRDSATVLTPAPAAQTVVQITDFAPDLDDNSITFILVTGFSGSVGNDLDANDDGVTDSAPWTNVLDALYLADTDGEPSLAASIGGTGSTAQSFTPAAAIMPQFGPVIVGAVQGTNPGPYNLDFSLVSPGLFAGEILSPGLPNTTGLAALPLNKVEFFVER